MSEGLHTASRGVWVMLYTTCLMLLIPQKPHRNAHILFDFFFNVMSANNYQVEELWEEGMNFTVHSVTINDTFMKWCLSLMLLKDTVCSQRSFQLQTQTQHMFSCCLKVIAHFLCSLTSNKSLLRLLRELEATWLDCLPFENLIKNLTCNVQTPTVWNER